MTEAELQIPDFKFQISIGIQNLQCEIFLNSPFTIYHFPFLIYTDDSLPKKIFDLTSR